MLPSKTLNYFRALFDKEKRAFDSLHKNYENVEIDACASLTRIAGVAKENFRQEILLFLNQLNKSKNMLIYCFSVDILIFTLNPMRNFFVKDKLFCIILEF